MSPVSLSLVACSPKKVYRELLACCENSFSILHSYFLSIFSVYRSKASEVSIYQNILCCCTNLLSCIYTTNVIRSSTSSGFLIKLQCGKSVAIHTSSISIAREFHGAHSRQTLWKVRNIAKTQPVLRTNWNSSRRPFRDRYDLIITVVHTTKISWKLKLNSRNDDDMRKKRFSTFIRILWVFNVFFSWCSGDASL